MGYSNRVFAYYIQFYLFTYNIQFHLSGKWSDSGERDLCGQVICCNAFWWHDSILTASSDTKAFVVEGFL